MLFYRDFLTKKAGKTHLKSITVTYAEYYYILVDIASGKRNRHLLG